MRRISLPHLQSMKQDTKKITMLTVYDAAFAHAASKAGVNIVFVGDSLGMVLNGQATTLAVSVDTIAYHTAAVVAGNLHSLVMSDLPFMSYYSHDIAAANSATLLKAGAEIIKIEGGIWLCDTVHFLSERGVPVCAHIGLTPQFVHMLGGFKIQGRSKEKAKELLDASIALEQAGAKLIVLECVPYLLAKEITEALCIPVIGIGAGPYCDGQVLVAYDLLGLSPGKPTKFVKNYLHGNPNGIEDAIRSYVTEVQENLFPTLEHSFE
jgi:3-methyl-2-oxobutanoate hydroxymethyltransferase